MANLIRLEGEFSWQYNNFTWDEKNNRWSGEAYTNIVSFEDIRFLVGSNITASLTAYGTSSDGFYMLFRYYDPEGSGVGEGDWPFIYIQDPPPDTKYYDGPIYPAGLLFDYYYEQEIASFDILLWAEFITSYEYNYSLGNYLIEGFDAVPDNSVIEGHVNYENGSPVPGASLEYSGYTAVTDDEGYYGIEITPEDMISSPDYSWPDNRGITADLIVHLFRIIMIKSKESQLTFRRQGSLTLTLYRYPLKSEQPRI